MTDRLRERTLTELVRASDAVASVLPDPARIVLLLTDYESGTERPLVERFPEAHVRVYVTNDPTETVAPEECRVTVVHAQDLATRMGSEVREQRPDVIIDLGRTRGQKVSSLRHLLYLLPEDGLFIVGSLDSGHPGVHSGESETIIDVLRTLVALETMSIAARERVRGVDRALANAVKSFQIEGGLVRLVKARQHYVKLRDWATDGILSARLGKDAKEDRASVVQLRPADRFKSAEPVHSYGDGPFASGHTEFEVPELYLRRYRGAIASARQILRMGDYVLPDSWRHPHQRNLNNRQMEYATAWMGAFKDETIPSERRVLEGSFYYFDTELPGHFGHITTDVLSRVWGWRAAKRIDPTIRPLVSVSSNSPDVPGFQRTIFSALGIDLGEAVVVGPREEVEIETLYAGSPELENPHYASPALKNVWRELSEGLPTVDAPEFGEKIFISRRPGGKRDCTNVAEVEAFFEAQGFSILFPEDYPYAVQHVFFRRARVIAGFGGSGMFNMMFAPSATVIMVSGSSYDAANEKLIGAVNENPLHYFWGKSELPMPEGRFSLQAFTSNFTFDVARFRGDLLRAVAE
ncbi:glycosyltransferase family 61 protein [Isoptericola sp. NPDC019482]|uniref:glycosyltransferase family 61 protein n=1 Tax=Isoptericola sp. NPDC019482 TaxID=3154688 RepID=UPI00348348C3